MCSASPCLQMPEGCQRGHRVHTASPVSTLSPLCPQDTPICGHSHIIIIINTPRLSQPSPRPLQGLVSAAQETAKLAELAA